MKFNVNLKELNLAYGRHIITAKSTAEGFADSDIASVIYDVGPEIYSQKGKVYVKPMVEGVTALEVYGNEQLLGSIDYTAPEAGDYQLDLDSLGIEDGVYKLFVKAIGEGIADNRSNVVNYYKGVEPIYGVKWVNDESTDMVRTDEAEDMSFAIDESTGNIASDFNDVFPYSEMTVEEVDGNSMVHFPTMYFRITTDEEGNLNGVAVSASEHDEGDWYEVPEFYYGAYGASSANNSTLRSVTGVNRLCNKTRAQFRKMAAETGQGYQQLDLFHKWVTTFLWWIEFATKNNNSIMTGKTAATGSTALPAGGTDSVETPSGFIPDTKQMRWHYIEDFIGNYYEFYDGVVWNNELYATADPALFADTSDGYNQLGFERTGSGNCIVAIGWDSENPFLCYPSKTINDGNYTKGFCNSTLLTAFTDPVVCGGAYWSNALANHGLLWFSRNSVTNSNPSLGGRLLKTL